MQDDYKLYAHADNEFEAEADEYPDEVEDGFDDDDEEEEEVSVIVATTAAGTELLTPPVSVAPPPPPPAKARGQKGCRQEDGCQASGNENRSENSPSEKSCGEISGQKGRHEICREEEQQRREKRQEGRESGRQQEERQ